MDEKLNTTAWIKQNSVWDFFVLTLQNTLCSMLFQLPALSFRLDKE